MIDPDIRKARTLPSSFYLDQHPFTALRESLFRHAWHLVSPGFPANVNVLPATILPGFLDEPVLLSRDKDNTLRCMPNVCTHRGNVLVSEAGNYPLLRCGYHGRCFGLDGTCRSQHGMEGSLGFPEESDNLGLFEVLSLGPMLFARLEKDSRFQESFTIMRKAMEWFHFDSLAFDPSLSRDFIVKAHWALYVDNYLEGYHVSFVHPELDKSLEPKEYQYQLFDQGALQTGFARENESAIFRMPPGHPDAGARVYAYYWWIFPNLMINIYPWGVSLNSIEPLGLTETRVRFLTFVCEGAGVPDIGAIHRTEFEDEAIVEQVQRGISSSFYRRGRYAPGHEIAVHHFHRMIAEYLREIEDAGQSA